MLYGNGLRTSYTYDERSRLTELHREKEVIRYSYDPAGNLTEGNYHTAGGASTKKLRYAYDAIGQRIAGQENIPNRLRYNAQIEDDLTGLYYLRVRYYNTGIGRFTQEDVIYNDGLNLYAYCSSNPVMYVDPSGYQKKEGCTVTKVAAENSKSGSKTKVIMPSKTHTNGTQGHWKTILDEVDVMKNSGD